MPRSKNPLNYPETYPRLLQAVYARREPVRVPLGSKMEANRMRNSLYAYVNAVEVQERKENVPESLRLFPQYRQVMLTVGEGPSGPFLELVNRNYTESVSAINDVLAALDMTAEEPPPPAPPIPEITPEDIPDGDDDTHADAISSLFGREI